LLHAWACAEPKPLEVGIVRGADTLVSIEAQDASVAELVRMLSRAAGVQIVLADTPDRKISVKLPNMPAGAAIEAICDGAGLKWTKRDGVFVLEPGNVRVEVSEGFSLSQSTWRRWDGRLSEEIATRDFEPRRTKVENGWRLTGTLGGVVEDLRAAGVDISIDPSATLGLVDTELGLPWRGGKNTVEHVLLRLALAVRDGSPDVALLQWTDQEGKATDRLRVVPGNRWGDPATFSNAYGAYGEALRSTLYMSESPATQSNMYVENPYAVPPGDVPAALQAKVDLELTDVPLSEALKAIEAKLGKPIGLAEGVKADKKVSVHAKDAPTIRVLTDVLGPLGLAITYAQGGEFDGVTVVPRSPRLPAQPSLFYRSGAGN
jgi:hypothetical protein